MNVSCFNVCVVGWGGGVRGLRKTKSQNSACPVSHVKITYDLGELSRRPFFSLHQNWPTPILVVRLLPSSSNSASTGYAMKGAPLSSPRIYVPKSPVKPNSCHTLQSSLCYVNEYSASNLIISPKRKVYRKRRKKKKKRGGGNQSITTEQ